MINYQATPIIEFLHIHVHVCIRFKLARAIEYSARARNTEAAIMADFSQLEYPRVKSKQRDTARVACFVEPWPSLRLRS